MIKSGDYIVLNKNNVEEVVELTGKPEKEIRETYEECVKFGHVQVYWREFSRWWSVRVDGHYERNGVLDNVVQEIMMRHGRRIE